MIIFINIMIIYIYIFNIYLIYIWYINILCRELYISRLFYISCLYCTKYISIYIYVYIYIYIYILSWKQCALSVITPMALPKCMSCHKAIVVIPGGHIVFIITYILHSPRFCEIWELCVSWITYDHYMYIYIYIYIYIFR